MCEFREFRRRHFSHSRELSPCSPHFQISIRPKYPRYSQQEMLWLKIFRTDSYCKQTQKDKSTVERGFVCLMASWYSDKSKSYFFDLTNFHSSFSDYVVNSASLYCYCLSDLPWFSLKQRNYFGDYCPWEIKRIETHHIILVYEEVKGFYHATTLDLLVFIVKLYI